MPAKGGAGFGPRGGKFGDLQTARIVVESQLVGETPRRPRIGERLCHQQGIL
jgi:hypothetical protein